MNNIQSLIFYIVSFLFSSIIITLIGSIYNQEKENKYRRINIIVLTILGLGVPIMISSLRYYVGTDYEQYIKIYMRYKNYPIIDIILNGKEKLFLVVIKIAALFNNAQVVFAIMAILTVTILYKTLFYYKDKRSLGFMFFLYIFMYFTNSFNLMKQTIAVVLIAYSYKYIFEQDFKKFIILDIIASMFHISALLFIPFYFTGRKFKDDRKSKLIRIAFIICTLIIVINYKSVINYISSFSLFEEYESYQNKVESANRTAILEWLVLTVILLFRKKLINYDEKNRLLIFFSIINCILLLTGYISPFIKRIGLYFGISNIFILSSLPQLAKNNTQKTCIYFLLGLYAIGIFIISTYFLKQANLIPYQIVFDNI